MGQDLERWSREEAPRRDAEDAGRYRLAEAKLTAIRALLRRWRDEAPGADPFDAAALLECADAVEAITDPRQPEPGGDWSWLNEGQAS